LLKPCHAKPRLAPDRKATTRPARLQTLVSCDFHTSLNLVRFWLLANAARFTHTSLGPPMRANLEQRQAPAFGGFMFAIAASSARVRFSLPIAIAISCCLCAAESRAYTMEQQQACMGDAFRLCSSEIPDIGRVKACMVRQQSQLSPPCRAFFRPEPPDPTAAGQSVDFKPTPARKLRRPRRPIQHDDT
jgi:hypothetical protein